MNLTGTSRLQALAAENGIAVAQRWHEVRTGDVWEVMSIGEDHFIMSLGGNIEIRAVTADLIDSFLLACVKAVKDGAF
jgi:hypothetical protein